MPRTKPLDAYPNAHYSALIAKVADGGLFTVPCTRPQAASLRGELYAWRRACQAAPDEAADLGVNVALLAAIGWRITDAGLETYHVAELQSAKLITAALGGEPLAQPTGAAAALQGLMKRLEADDGAE